MNIIPTVCVGSRFRPPAPAVLFRLPYGTPLVFRREPDNPYDSNAVAIWLDEVTPDTRALLGDGIELPLQLGYVPRREAATLALGWREGDRPGRFIEFVENASKVEVER